MREAVGQSVDVRRKLTRERPAGASCGGLRAGIDQVGNGFGLGQVELAV